jgi:hypothetical protein
MFGMKYLVFVEDSASRKQIEDLLSATSLPHEIVGLDALLVKGRTEGFSAVVTEHETWQRNASILRYFDCLDGLNQKPMLVFSRLKRQNGIKLRRTKAQTLHSPLPAQVKDVQPLFLQLG